MSSVARVVERNLESEPFLKEALARKIINYGALAVELKQGVEREVGKPVRVPTIAMALHRLAEKHRATRKSFRVGLKSELNMKTGLVDVTLARSPSLINRVRELYGIVDFKQGDFLNIIWGMYEVGIILNDHHLEDARKILAREEIINTEQDMTAVFMRFGKEFFYTPGGLSRITTELAWHGINVYEAISTMTEFTILVKKKNLTRTFEVLDALFAKK
ncbi:MAG: ACT domain-containing protein [Candidatus Diapherotrites archaeon]|nr:ACT domain-containing protein [Candidatus Diapherotrites archaeon]